MPPRTPTHARAATVLLAIRTFVVGLAAAVVRRIVRKRLRDRETLLTVVRGPGWVGGGRAEDAISSLTYRRRAPYGVHIAVVIADRAASAEIGRDLFVEALRDGTAGTGNARVVRTSRSVTVTVHNPRGVLEAAFPVRVVRRAVRRWYTAVPAGTETMSGLDAALDELLRPRSPF